MTRLVLLTAAAAILSACERPAGAVPAAAAPPGAMAGDADRGPLQAGLWETTTVDATAGGAPDVARVCIGGDEKGPAEDVLKQFDDPDCTVSRPNGPAGATTHAECVKDGVTFVTDASMAARRTTYTFTLTTRATMPGGSVHESRISANGRRLGPCPAGMAPGETDAG